MNKYNIAAIVRVVLHDVHYFEHSTLKTLFVSAGFDEGIRFCVNTMDNFHWSLASIDGEENMGEEEHHNYISLLVTIVGEQENVSKRDVRRYFKRFLKSIEREISGATAKMEVLGISE